MPMKTRSSVTLAGQNKRVKYDPDSVMDVYIGAIVCGPVAIYRSFVTRPLDSNCQIDLEMDQTSLTFDEKAPFGMHAILAFLEDFGE